MISLHDSRSGFCEHNLNRGEALELLTSLLRTATVITLTVTEGAS